MPPRRGSAMPYWQRVLQKPRVANPRHFSSTHDSGSLVPELDKDLSILPKYKDLETDYNNAVTYMKEKKLAAIAMHTRNPPATQGNCPRRSGGLGTVFAEVVCGSRKHGENIGWSKCTDCVYLHDAYSNQCKVRGEVQPTSRHVSRGPKSKSEKKSDGNVVEEGQEEENAQAPQAPAENAPAEVVGAMVHADDPTENASALPSVANSQISELQHDQAQAGPAPKINQEVITDDDGKTHILAARIIVLEEEKKQSLTDNKALFRLSKSKKVENTELQGQMKRLLDENAALEQQNYDVVNEGLQRQIKLLTNEIAGLKKENTTLKQGLDTSLPQSRDESKEKPKAKEIRPSQVEEHTLKDENENLKHDSISPSPMMGEAQESQAELISKLRTLQTANGRLIVQNKKLMEDAASRRLVKEESPESYAELLTKLKGLQATNDALTAQNKKLLNNAEDVDILKTENHLMKLQMAKAKRLAEDSEEGPVAKRTKFEMS